VRRVGLRVFCGFVDAKFRSTRHSKNLMEQSRQEKAPAKALELTEASAPARVGSNTGVAYNAN